MKIDPIDRIDLRKCTTYRLRSLLIRNIKKTTLNSNFTTTKGNEKYHAVVQWYDSEDPIK